MILVHNDFNVHVLSLKFRIDFKNKIFDMDCLWNPSKESNSDFKIVRSFYRSTKFCIVQHESVASILSKGGKIGHNL